MCSYHQRQVAPCKLHGLGSVNPIVVRTPRFPGGHCTATHNRGAGCELHPVTINECLDCAVLPQINQANSLFCLHTLHRPMLCASVSQTLYIQIYTYMTYTILMECLNPDTNGGCLVYSTTACPRRPLPTLWRQQWFGCAVRPVLSCHAFEES